MEPLHIFIYNEIGSGGVTPDDIQAQLKANPNAEEIVVHISSGGGEVFDGWTIGNILRNSDKKVTVIIEGLCASIATYIALQGDTVKMTETGRFMIHNPTVGAQGDAKEMGNAKALLEGITNDLVKSYLSRTKLEESVIRNMMDEETFMTPEEAKKNGFIDEIISGVKAVAYLDKKHINMNPKEKEEASGILKNIEGLFAKYFKNSVPKNMMVELASGGAVFVESEDGDLTGKKAFAVDEEGNVTDTPAPDGDHELKDGRVLVVADGVVDEIREGSDDEAAKMKAQIEELTAKLEEATASKKAVEDSAKQTDEVVKELVEQVENLSKLTVGGSFKPVKANIKPQSRTPEPKSALSGWGANLPISKNFKAN